MEYFISSMTDEVAEYSPKSNCRDSRFLPSVIVLTLCVFFSQVTNGQIGVNCATPLVIASLPYNATGSTTCGFGDNYSANPLTTCTGGDFAMDGEEIIYTYTPASDENIAITLNTNIAPPPLPPAIPTIDPFAAVYVYDACPSIGSCLAFAEGEGVSCVFLTGGTTYYIVVSSMDMPPSSCVSDFDISIVSQAVPVAPACNLNYPLSSITHSPYNNVGTDITFTDDEFASSSTSIGFDFCFDGKTYSNVLISSNGYLLFEDGCNSYVPGGNGVPSGASPFGISAAVPNTSNAPRNAVMLWHDIDPSVGGNIRTNVHGTAPNRVFVTKFIDVPMFLCNALLFSAQIMLFETSNNIEIHITKKPVCTTFNDGAAILALQNYNGSISVGPAAYNHPTQWTVVAASPEAYLFTNNCGACTVLPVELLYFDGYPEGENNILVWTTLTEINNDLFEVERSLDGINFEKIGEIKGGGNSNTRKDYLFPDQHPVIGLAYYRLKQIDFDGKFEHSRTIALNAKAGNVVGLFPNPTKGMLNLKISSKNGGDFRVIISDLIGREIVKNLNIEPGKSTIRLDDFMLFPAGYYTVKITEEHSNFIQVEKIIKE